MKVAIVGAGLSGLSCAIELKRNGVIPVIYEKSQQIGDSPAYMVAMLRLFYKSLVSPMNYLDKNYGIKLKELHALDELVMISPRKRIVAKGKLGYIFTKGTEPVSIENQLYGMLDIPIHFGSDINIGSIIDDYDYIVVASASHLIPEELKVWNSTFQAQVRIATIKGDFKPGLMKIWLNKQYSKNGYAYMITKDNEQAELVLIVSFIEQQQLSGYWDRFIQCENIKYAITKTVDSSHNVGYPTPVQLGKILFAGNAGGMIDNFLGFGSMKAMASGVLAARAIAHKLDYSQLIKPLQHDVAAMHEYRKMINSLSNEEYDKLLAFIGLPVIKQALYNNPLYKAKFGLFFPKLITGLKRIRNS